jgi:hypothetical protein
MGIAKVMATRTVNRFSVMIALSSDHAGIGRELQALEREMYRVQARLEDSRAVARYIRYLCEESREWLQNWSKIESEK